VHTLSRAVCLCAAILGISSTIHAVPALQWSNRYGDEQAIVWETTYDLNGNLLVVGQFEGPIDFGGGPIGTAIGDQNIFVAKFNSAGVHQWSKSIGDAGLQYGYGIASDGVGNVYVTGAIVTGTANFGGGALGPGAFLAKFAPSGAHAFSKVFAGGGGVAVGCDPGNNIYLGGVLTGASIDLGGGALGNAGLGTTDIFLAKFNSGGGHLWSKTFGDADSQFIYSLAVSRFGDVAIAGNVYGSANFGGGVLASAGAGDASLAKFDTAGNHVFSKLFGTGATQTGFSVAIDPSGNVYYAGFYFGSLDLGGGAFASAGADDCFLAKYDAAGNHLWSKTFGDVDPNSTCPAIAAGGTWVYLTTQFSGTIDVGGGPMTAHANALDMVLVRFEGNGSYKWSKQFGTDNSTVSPWGITTVSRGVCGSAVAVGGDFYGTVNFGGGNLVNNHAGGRSQAWIAEFCDDEPIPVLISRFAADATGAGIEVSWDVRSDEAIESFALYRHEGVQAPVTVASGAYDSQMKSFVDANVEPGRTYGYELVLRTPAGSEFRSPQATATARVLQATLEQNHPNPFNPSTTIAYTIDERTNVVVGIYDAAGTLVTRLEQGEQAPGRHEATWNGVDASGRAVGSGVYFYRLESGSGAGSRKMVLLK
jgi:hypothetical protein